MSFLSWLAKIFTGTIERPSPSDLVPSQDITVSDWSIQIDLHNLPFMLVEPPEIWFPSIPDTNSMDGAFDIGHNVLYIKGSNLPDKLRIRQWLWQQPVGNVVVYLIPNVIYAVHRIVKKGTDAQGRYYILKGDNNPVADPYRVREENIEWLSIGVIY